MPPSCARCWAGGLRPGKYTLAQKAMHHGIALLCLAARHGAGDDGQARHALWLQSVLAQAAATWGGIYVVHGLAALCMVTAVMLHRYFALRPEKRCYLRAMLSGWMSRSDCAARHDPAVADDCAAGPRSGNAAMSPAARAALQQTMTRSNRAYEFMLAYAAQGRDSEPQSPEPTIRSTLQALGVGARRSVRAGPGLRQPAQPRRAAIEEFLSVARRDVVARARPCLALAVPSIGSAAHRQPQCIDPRPHAADRCVPAR
jgi:hypothetical protein